MAMTFRYLDKNVGYCFNELKIISTSAMLGTLQHALPTIPNTNSPQEDMGKLGSLLVVAMHVAGWGGGGG